MNVIKYPSAEQYASICERPHMDVSQLNSIVAGVLDDIKQRGDDAVKDYEEKFDHVRLANLQVTEAEIDEAYANIDAELREAIILAHKNIHTFHAAQKFDGTKVETAPGVVCCRRLWLSRR